MNYAQLLHAIRAACDVSKDHELYVFGSQAILGTHHAVPLDLPMSIEVDIQPKNLPDAVDDIDGALGEGSMFHATHGFYVHGVDIHSATLPRGWEDRTVPVSNSATRGGIGHCIEIHDLAASKLAAWREKDLVFVNTLIAELLVDRDVLLARIADLPMTVEDRERLSRWVAAVAADVG